MIHSILLQIKTDAVAWVVGTGIVAVCGLLANEVTSPKVFAVMIFLSDWNAVWTWEWWLRMIIGLVFGTGIWLLQKRKSGKQLRAREALWEKQFKDLRDDLRHAQALLVSAGIKVTVLERK